MYLNFNFHRTAVITWQDEVTCNGVLISDQFVISSFHCLADKIEFYLIYLGIFDLDDLNMFQGLEAEKTFLSNFSDVGLVQLKNRVVLSGLIQPICLYDSEILPESTGIVGGYQKILSGFRNLPLAMNLTITNFENCRNSNLKFCAHPLYTTQCTGHFGTGFFMLHNGTFYLRGVLSFWSRFRFQQRREGGEIQALPFHKFYCTPDDILVFNNISSHMSWIDEVLKHNSDKDSKTIEVKQPKIEKVKEKLKPCCFRDDCLLPGESWISQFACYRIIFHHDGLLRAYRNQKPYIDHFYELGGKGAVKACMLKSGNFAIFNDKNETIWSSATHSNRSLVTEVCLVDYGKTIIVQELSEPRVRLFSYGDHIYC